MKNERRAIPGHLGYFADRTGRIWTNSLGYWRLIKSSINGTGYQYTTLRGSKQYLTQRLVCSAFKGKSTKNTPVCIRKAKGQQPRRVRMQKYLNWGDRTQVKQKPFTRLNGEEKMGVLTL